MGCARWLAAIAFVLGSTIGLEGSAAAQPVMPPCSGSTAPPYADVNHQPNIATLSAISDDAWEALKCTGLQKTDNQIVIGVAGTFMDSATPDAILERFGKLSRLAGVKYWSVTDAEWETLITKAVPLEGPDESRARADFTIADLKSGRPIYFSQLDNRSSEAVIYRVQVRASNPENFVVEMENATPVKALGFVTIFRPGEIKHQFFVRRKANDSWSFYELLSASGRFANRSEASFVNRAVALYRHFAGIQTDSDPPARTQ